MVLFGRIIDFERKSAIQGATVSIVMQNLSPAGIETTTDEIGRFMISNGQITLTNYIVVSHPNYQSRQLAITGASDYGFVVLQAKPVELSRPPDETTTVTKNNTWLWILLVPALLYVFSNKKRR